MRRGYGIGMEGRTIFHRSCNAESVSILCFSIYSSVQIIYCGFMKVLFRKINSAYLLFREGDFVGLFNAVFQMIGIRSWLSIGKTKIFSLLPANDYSRQNIPLPEETVFPFSIESETKPEIIPLLLDCMAGCASYSYLSTEAKREKLEYLQRKGSTVWLARDQGEIIGFFWVTSNVYRMPCSSEKIDLYLQEKDAFIEFIFVKASYRRKGVYSGILRTVHRNFPEIIFSCVVDVSNTPSIQSQLKNGFQPVGKLLYFRICGRIYASLRFKSVRKFFFHVKKGSPYRIKSD
jgi:GNAT superfamily N-acetyltransferase